MMIERARQLIAGGDVDHVLAWEQGEHPWDRVPAVFTAENIDNLKYDTFCGPNLSKYLVAEAAKEKKEEGKKILVFLKPCDTYSYNQLISEHRIDADRVYPIGVGCRGKVDVEKVRALGIKGILDIEDCGDTLNVHTLYGEASFPSASAATRAATCAPRAAASSACSIIRIPALPTRPPRMISRKTCSTSFARSTSPDAARTAANAAACARRASRCTF